MNEWLNNFDLMLTLVLGWPASQTEKWVMAVLSFVIMVWVYSKMANATRIPNTGPIYTVFMVVFGLFAMLGCMVLAKLYLPLWEQADARIWILVGTSLLVLLVVVVPVMIGVQGCTYGAGFMTWMISICAAALIVVIVGAGFDAFSSGGKDASRTMEHRKDLEEMMGR